MEKNMEKFKLDMDMLDNVAGGAQTVGSCTGPVCPECGFAGEHKAVLNYEREGNTITVGATEVYCGKCNYKIK